MGVHGQRHGATGEPGGQRFSDVLREATREQHEAAEASPFMAALTSGKGRSEWYVALAAQLWSVYDALEGGARRLREDGLVSPFLDPRLDRVHALESDLALMAGPEWRDTARPLPATAAYAGRIADTAARSPATYVAHHYTRYLGDLSGGQILKRVLERDYGLHPDRLTFFDFPDLGRTKPYKDAYRRRLDDFGARLDPAGRDDVVAEARAAFDFNRDVFSDVARTLHHAA